MKIIVLGGQGSGKSTQAKLLAEKLNVPHIEMGQLLREKAKESNEEAKSIKASLDSGILVSDKITVKVLKEKLEEPQLTKGFVLDGYPRNSAQLEGLTEGDFDKVLYIKVSDEEAISRLLKRGREDDSKELIAKRLEVYHTQTEPLLEHFRNSKKLSEVDGERRIEDIHQDVIKTIQENEQ